MEPIRIRLLGPVGVVVDGELVPPGPQGRKLLALLAVSVNHSVMSDTLTELLWEDQHPPHEADSLQSQIARLRRLFEDDVIVRENHGYVLTIDPDLIDACRFDNLVSRALDELGHDPAAALRLSREGLELWHGTPFGDIGDLDVLMIETYRLEELRLVAVEVAYEAELAMGRHERVIPSLHAAVGDFPYREKLWYLLITALARDGRRVEALRSYQELSELLGNVGLTPGPDLRELQQRIYSDDETVTPHLAEHTRSAEARRND